MVGAVHLQSAPMASNMSFYTHHRSTQKLKQWLLHGFKCKLGPKMWWNIEKLAGAPDFYHTVSPRVGYGWGSKPSKHYYGFEYNLRYITQYSTGKDTGLKSNLGPQCGENIKKNGWRTLLLPQCHTTRLQVGSGWGSKPPKHSYGFIHDLRHITGVLKC